MQEEVDDALVHEGTFGEGEGFAYETAQALTERIVEAFDVIFRPSIVGGAMLPLRFGENVVIAVQGVGVEGAVTVGRRDTVSKARGGGVTVRPQGIASR